MENHLIEEFTDSLQIEITSEIAQFLLEKNSDADEDIYVMDDEGNTSYTSQAQKRFDELYDVWLQNVIIFKPKMKATFVAIDTSILVSYPYETIKNILPNHEILAVSDSFLMLEILGKKP